MRSSSIVAFTVALAACSNAGVASAPNALRGEMFAAAQQRSVSSVAAESPAIEHFRVLYSFLGGLDGRAPAGKLVSLNGNLYGTTLSGGGTGCGQIGCGTVFTINPAGTENVVYRFRGGTDGSKPYSGLLNVNGTLYGTTVGGGGGNCAADGFFPGCGTVFAISPSGTESVIYRFRGGVDGAHPTAGLINVDGNLYGTTAYGGGSGCQNGDGCGTVFSVGLAGEENVVYRFQGGTDGAEPIYSALLNVRGTLYGTTALGGGTSCRNGMDSGCGTIFEINSDSESVVYRFQGGSDGASPFAGLVTVDGILYGTTVSGGGTCVNDGSGCGTVFAISSSGTESVLHRFQSQPDGEVPEGTLLATHGALYGTTVLGGANGNGGYGTVFKISTAGSEAVLNNFTNRDGAEPIAGLLDVSGTLYGTTEGGGARCLPNGRRCFGTVFAWTP